MFKGIIKEKINKFRTFQKHSINLICFLLLFSNPTFSQEIVKTSNEAPRVQTVESSKIETNRIQKNTQMGAKKRSYRKNINKSQHCKCNPCMCDPCGCQPSFFCFEPYVGVSGGILHMRWEQAYGGNLFKKEYPQLDGYLGFRFCDFLGAEVGYKVTSTQTNYVPIGTQDVALGIPPLALDPVLGIINVGPELHRASALFKGWHADLVGYLPLSIFNDPCSNYFSCNCVQLLGFVGINRFYLDQWDKKLQDRDLAFRHDTETFRFKAHRNILSLGLGLQFQRCDYSIRLKIGYENTGRFNPLILRQFFNGPVTATLKVKDSYNYNLGFIFYFF